MILTGVKLYYCDTHDGSYSYGSVTFEIANYSATFMYNEIRRRTYAKDLAIEPITVKRLLFRFVIPSTELDAGGNPQSQDATAKAKWEHLQAFDGANFKRIDVGSATVDSKTYLQTANFANYTFVSEDGPQEFEDEMQTNREVSFRLITRAVI